MDSDNVGRDIPAIGSVSRSRRRAFTRDEVGAIFALPIFVKPWSVEPHHQISNETLRWLLLIALTSGARLEEIGQLQPDDIRMDDDIAYMAIDDVDALGAKSLTKSIKNASARRRVPLHSDLLKLGLQERATRLSLEGAEHLFPDLHVDAFGHYTSNASRCCNRLIDKVTRDPRVVFHSLRHFFKDLCREAGMLESVSDQLTGHAPISIGGRYGSGVSLTELKTQLEHLRFEFVDWERIYAASRL
jgi:integrase